MTRPAKTPAAPSDTTPRSTETPPPQQALSPERAAARAAFLENAHWADATSTPIAGDASTRAYERLTKNGETAVLMNASPGAEEADCPRDAGPDERRRLGYNAMARLAGPNLNAFLAVADALRAAGLAAPAVYAADPINGFALLEDLGEDLLARAVDRSADEQTLYDSAIDVLIALRKSSPKPPDGPAYAMLDYDETALIAEADLLPEWYADYRGARAFTDSERAALDAAWRKALAQLSPPSLIVLRDYHAENLLWLPGNEGARRLGVIDFQDGLFGHPAYDLVSLLEDARRDVSPTVTKRALQRYLDGAREIDPAFDEAAFHRDYALLGAQRNAKILGIFARLIVRDGKTRYEDFFERVENHFRGDLKHPALAEVRAVLRGPTPALTD